MRLYFALGKFRIHVADWFVVGILLAFFFLVAETAHPFHRQFEVNNPKLSHPFAESERITDNQLYLLTCILPSILLTFFLLLNGKTNFERLHLAQVTNLGFWLTIAAVGVITDLLKVWISNPRPDFLQRCGVDPKITSGLVDVLVCLAPLGEMYLWDGLKLTPSGHSSFAFAGLGFLSLWLMGQYKVWENHVPLWKPIGAMMPLTLASYIALSRSQDYRHHLFDISFGSCIGAIGAWLGYHRYFPSVASDNSEQPIEYTQEK